MEKTAAATVEAGVARGGFRAAQCGRLVVYLLVVWTPLPLASNRPIFWAINGFAASAALFLFVIGEAKARGDTLNWRPIAWLSLGLAAWSLWMIFQVAPGVPFSLWHPVWSYSGDIAPISNGRISGSPAATWATVAETAPIVFLAVIAARLAANSARIFFLLNLILATALAVAVWGLAAQYFNFRQVFLLDTVAYQGFLTSTFVGRNAAATYFAIALAVSISLMATRLQHEVRRVPLSSRRTLAMIELFRPIAIYLLSSLILTVALLGTGSRGGALAGGAAVLTALVISAARSPSGQRLVSGLLLLVVGALMTIVALSGGILFARFGEDDTSDGRLLVYRDTIDMIRARPLLGHGAGAFGDIYPLYHQLAPSYGVWNRTHDTYLQAAAELGLPMTILLAAMFLAVLGIALHGLRRGGQRPAAVAALGASVGVALQAFVDFSAQIQAVSVVMIILLGAAVGESLRGRAKEAAATQPQLQSAYVPVVQTAS